ncbi:uncharacterized protein DUF955 [Acinetobacter sp. BIGb0102]|uniref:ImmA/IrrE family metallo-endopeptidase n=1 Tax=Acinetobacter TaxID=469 RepID=UPI0003B922C3|nr:MULTISPECIES: ImmA/IrrE family metallo-endopeptidase [Acinetobacter]ERS04086.1 hypothetical protein Q674_08050 [Acinetobacter sp. COS3]RPE31142.1 uncharacterized protein DUF955 [Acinetobacter sp. BIGb0102]
MNILDIIHSNESLNDYYQLILRLCDNYNYRLALEYKSLNDSTPNLGYFLDEGESGVIRISTSLNYEEKISCIAHELAHVELNFLGDTNELCYQIERITYPYDFNLLKVQIFNFLQHLLIDDILTENQLSNQLYHSEILKTDITHEFPFTIDEFYAGSSREELIVKMKNLFLSFKEVENNLSKFNGNYMEVDCSLLSKEYSLNVMEIVRCGKTFKNLRRIEDLALILINTVKSD